MSCERMVVSGVNIQYSLKKCQVSASLAEYLVKFTPYFDINNTTELQSAMPSILEKRNQRHFTYTNIDTVSSFRNAIHLYLSCAICSIEETSRHSLKIKKMKLYQNMRQMEYCK